jgi:hypothetical protein
MILKKRDLYFFLILLSFVGYAICQRIYDKTKKIQGQSNPVIKETVFVPQSPAQNDLNATSLR